MNCANLLITITDKDKNSIKALNKYFNDLYNVQVLKGNIVQVPNADCIVCPGNSYGIMDSGVERTISLILNGIQIRVQQVIKEAYYGEQPVGSCILLETFNNRYKYIANVPTCRYPSDVSSTHNAYTAFRALLTTVLNHNKISENKITSIVCTGFCTGVGQMDPEESARQMRLAYNLVDLGMDINETSVNFINQLLT